MLNCDRHDRYCHDDDAFYLFLQKQKIASTEPIRLLLSLTPDLKKHYDSLVPSNTQVQSAASQQNHAQTIVRLIDNVQLNVTQDMDMQNDAHATEICKKLLDLACYGKW